MKAEAGEGIAIEQRADVLRIVLSRPARLNALDGAAIAALTRAFEAVGPARAVVLTGAGRSFCAGADVEWMERSSEPQARLADSRSLHRLLAAVDGCAPPVVVAVRGHALGAGCGLAACADIVIAAPDASFGLPETRAGLIPAVVAPFVLARIGAAAGRRYLVTGERMDAQEAWRRGLVDELADDLDAQVERILDAIGAAAPAAARAAKRLVREQPGPEEQARRMVAARAGEEAQAGLAALAGKSAPPWAR